MKTTPNAPTIVDVQIDLQPVQTQVAPADSLADIDAEALRVLVQQLQADLKAKTAEIAEVRGQNVKLKNERDDYDKIGKDALSKMRIAERDRDELKPQIKTLNENLKAARTRADQLDADLTAARRGELEAKAAAAESGLRAEAAEHRLEQLTAPKPGGHIIARNISEAELDALADEGRKVIHFQFMPDGTLNAVIEPCVPHVQPSRPRNQSMVTPSGLPIPPIGRQYPPRVPATPVPSHNAPRQPAPANVTAPAAPRTGAPLQPAHVADTATRALIIAPKPIDIPPAADAPKRVPTFNEILAARLSGRINADQFTKYANALAGHNARQKVGAMHS